MKITKWILIALVLIISVGAILHYTIQYQLNHHFDELLNEYPERSYDIKFKKISVDNLYSGVELKEVSIIPRSTSSSVEVYAEVEMAALKGLSWARLVLLRQLNVGDIIFVRPKIHFSLYPQEEKKSKVENSLQNLFKDLIIRGKLKNFRLVEGAALVTIHDSTQFEEFANIGGINIDAVNIQTDSIIFKYTIPFKMEAFHSSFDSISVSYNKHYKLKVGKIQYSSQSDRLKVNDISLRLNKPWREVSRNLGKQFDIFEFEVAKLEFANLDAMSSFVGSQVNIQADKLVMDSVRFTDYRDKNMERPQEEVKPMFIGILDSISFPFKLDTIQIRNAELSYYELQEDSEETMTIKFRDLFGSLYHITNIAMFREESKNIVIDLLGNINNTGHLRANMNISYRSHNFICTATYSDARFENFNSMIKPLAGVSLEQGTIKKFELLMEANNTSAKSRLQFIYDNLKVNVLHKNDNRAQHKSGVLSLVANAAIHNSNLPEDRHYREAEFKSTRNIYRGPFNFIAHTISEGLVLIIPRKVVSKAILKDEYDGNSAKKKK